MPTEHLALVGTVALLCACQGPRPCNDETVYLTLELDEQTRQAEQILVETTLDRGGVKGPSRAATPAHHSGERTATIELDFPNSYPSGALLVVRVTALRTSDGGGTLVLGAASDQFQLMGRCVARRITVPGGADVTDAGLPDGGDWPDADVDGPLPTDGDADAWLDAPVVPQDGSLITDLVERSDTVSRDLVADVPLPDASAAKDVSTIDLLSDLTAAADGASDAACTYPSRTCQGANPLLCTSVGKWYVEPECTFGCTNGTCDAPPPDAGISPEPALTLLATLPSPGNFCQGLTWDGEALWMIDDLHDLIRFSPSGEISWKMRKDELPLSDLAWDGSGIWFAYGDRLEKLDRDGNKVDVAMIRSHWPDSGLEIGGGAFWLGDSNSGYVYKHGQDGQAILDWPTGSPGPRAMTMRDQTLIVSEYQVIGVYDLQGRLLAQFNISSVVPGPTDEIKCLAWDGSALWVSLGLKLHRVSVPVSECAVGQQRCDNKVQQTCSQRGQWLSGTVCKLGCHHGLCATAAEAQPGYTAPVQILSTIPSPGSRCRGMTWDGQALWFIDDFQRLYRIDRAGKILATATTQVYGKDLEWETDGMWTASPFDLVKIDVTGKMVDIREGLGSHASGGVAWSGGFFWLGDGSYPDRIHKHTFAGIEVRQWPAPVGPTGLAADDSALWAVGSKNDIVRYAFDDGRVLFEFDLRRVGVEDRATWESNCVAWDGKSLWYSSGAQFVIHELGVPTPIP
jgi:hypothetical protein